MEIKLIKTTKQLYMWAHISILRIKKVVKNVYNSYFFYENFNKSLLPQAKILIIII